MKRPPNSIAPEHGESPSHSHESSGSFDVTKTSRYQVLADKVAFWLTIIAISVGTLTFIVWLTLADLIFSINRAVTVLVITCPHALGLAIPLVIANSTGLAARNGILVRNRDSLERAKNIKIVAFDKTGTLTQGKFGVQHIAADGMDENQALSIAAALENPSEHPLAKAIVDFAKQRQLDLPQMKDFQTVTGRGVEGINDAAALLEANMGLAIGAGTNVAIESADLVLVEDDPLDAVKALVLAKKTYGKMIQNLFWATGYNVIAIPLAAGVLSAWGFVLSPAVGALLMSLSTVIVAINAMMLRRAKLA